MAKNLWKGKRGAQDDVRREEEETFPSVEADYVSVGDTLRIRREERGEDLRYVAQILRIRYPYLKAIEDGHPDELPGPTYAVGFVRTYADHLGLPSEELVQQFKEEAANLQARADLHFPAPIPEGKIPSGAVLVIAVVLAAAVYAGWIYLSSQEQQVAEIVPQLPNRISEIIKGDNGDSGDPNAAAKPDLADKPAGPPQTNMTAAATPASPKPANGDTETAAETPATPPQQSTPAPESATAAAPGQPSEPESAAVPAVEAGQSEVASVAPETRPETRTMESIPTPPGGDTASTGSEASAEPSDATPRPEPTESASVESETTTEPSAEADRAPPKTYGGENNDARIIIHAAADSWVEVRDSATDELLLTRVLFKGDKYLVPDRDGLTLLTGNAGGLRIVVDGSAAPPIGPLGAVRRNVVLEPSPLLSGNAARRSDGNSIRTDSQTSEGDFQSQ